MRSRSKIQNADTARGEVVIVGLGYVGLPLALLARKKGFGVAGIDVDERKLEQIKKREVPDLDRDYAALLSKGKPLAASDTFESVAQADTVVICVPTPVDEEHVPDLTLAKSACSSVARHMKTGQLIILESTVHPGTAEEMLIPLMEKESGLTVGVDFGFAHCPERINPGDAEWPLHRIPRVIGATTKDALKKAGKFYRTLLEAPVLEMESIREAEAVKMVENCFRDINIAFVNELAMSFSKLNIDIVHVLDGAATKPFGFMRFSPGCGVGGHCIPVDPYYLIRYARENGFTHEFLSLARSINNQMPSFAVSLLKQELDKIHRKLSASTVALLGLSYKANISDLRESPALTIRQLVADGGAVVKVFDPYTPHLSNVHSVDEALKGADAVIIATAHDEFKLLPPEKFLGSGVRIVIDGRNCLPKEKFKNAGIAYRGIGR